MSERNETGIIKKAALKDSLLKYHLFYSLTQNTPDGMRKVPIQWQPVRE
jgi:hypothetical protein